MIGAILLLQLALLVAIVAEVRMVRTMKGEVMANLEDLKLASANLTTSVNQSLADMTRVINALTPDNSQQGQIDAITAEINTNLARMQTISDAAASAVPPPPVVAPTT
jgi:hypothetical protein